MASIKDVAKLAGVSVSAVSKVFNGYTDIGEKTKEKVIKVAKELEYSPNIVAQSLSKKQTNSIALILSNFNESNGEDGTVFKVMSGVFQGCSENGYELSIFTATQSQQQEKSYYQMCRERNVGGVIIMGLKTTDRYFTEIINSEIPSVVVDTQIIGENTSSISIDNIKAAKEAVTFLIKNGHRNIGFINGHNKAVVSKERREGYIQALREEGIKVKERFIGDCEYSEIKSYMNAERYLKKNPELTAIFFASDFMAIGFMRRCKEIGVKVPEDISVMGFDDINLCKYVSPPLSTINQDFWKMGYESVKLLLGTLKYNKKGIHKNLEEKIVDRASIRRI
ncbi:LacI family DNA-binding transcriptional regulator [Clostridium perfringens]|nr:LacI family DNA-binding transcriptional regulator [Clostridium perfringens]